MHGLVRGCSAHLRRSPSYWPRRVSTERSRMLSASARRRSGSAWLWARPAEVLKHVLLGAMALVWIGTGAGLLGAFWATSPLRALLFGVSLRDPVIYASVVVGMVAVGLLASVLPAHRAASADPVRALRSQ
jgi:hypothetical protein